VPHPFVAGCGETLAHVSQGYSADDSDAHAQRNQRSFSKPRIEIEDTNHPRRTALSFLMSREGFKAGRK
jgi:hypothetical protein